MAAQKALNVSIELLPREDWEKGTLGKLLKWLLTIGRYIVIFTELIVILAFLTRFKLDRDLENLNQTIEEKQTEIQALAQFEKKFLFLQTHLKAIENLQKRQVKTNQVLTELAALTPIDVYFSELSLRDKEVSLTATALSEAGLSTFLDNLQKSDRFDNLVLSQVSAETEKEIGIQFQLKSDLVANLK